MEHHNLVPAIIKKIIKTVIKHCIQIFWQEKPGGWHVFYEGTRKKRFCVGLLEHNGPDVCL